MRGDPQAARDPRHEVPPANGLGVAGVVDGPRPPLRDRGEHGGDRVVEVAEIEPGTVAGPERDLAGANPFERPVSPRSVEPREAQDHAADTVPGGAEHQLL